MSRTEERRSHKLTMVSLMVRGRRHVVFVRLPLDREGRPFVADIQALARRVGLEMDRGSTFSVG